MRFYGYGNRKSAKIRLMLVEAAWNLLLLNLPKGYQQPPFAFNSLLMAGDV
jgi:hypothetical protein